MNILDILSNIWLEIVASLFVFFLGNLASRIPKIITQRRLKAFFGNAVLADNLNVVQGFLADKVRNENGPTWTKCYKIFHVRPPLEVGIPSRFTGVHDIQASAYIVQELARYRKKSIPIKTDEEAYRDLNNTFITVGGPLVNEITYLALKDENNHFLEMTIREPLDTPNVFQVVEGNNNRRFFQRTSHKDYGFLLKIRNSRFPQHFFFVCMGIGGWGTGSAAWYLSNHWLELFKEFNDKEFLIVLEVSRGSYTSGIRILEQHEQ